MITARLSPRRDGPPKKDSFYIPSLDGIRAASVLWVFLAHAGLEGHVPGNFGVTVFFFLSGFLITTLLRMEFDKSGGISLTAFYLRRTLRIFPPMYLALGLASALSLAGALEGSLQADAVLAQVFHLSNYYIIHAGWWDGRAPGTWIYWSLAVEEHFYLVFPLFYLLLRRVLPSRRHQAMVLLGICAAVLGWRLILVFGLDALKDRTYVATDTRVDSILFGCILAVYGNPVLDHSRVSDRWWKAFWLPLGMAGVLLSFVVRDPKFQETLRYTLQGLALFPLFIVAIRYHDWAVFRLLNVEWIKSLGVLSYSIYLVHTTILYGVHQWTTWHPMLQGALALVLSILLATAIYRLVEKPCAGLRKRLSRVGSDVRGDAAAHRPPSPTPTGQAATASSSAESPWLPVRT